MPNRTISASDAAELMVLFESEGIMVWIDGGWAVDALLDGQTRPHGDLDLVVREQDAPHLRKLLEARGYTDQDRDDTTAWNFVLGDAAGRDVDLHVVALDTAGDGVYGPPERGMRYPADSLTGRGRICGHPVRCIAPEWLVKFHTGYAIDAQDIRDVLALHRRFGVALPAEYAQYRESDGPKG